MNGIKNNESSLNKDGGCSSDNQTNSDNMNKEVASEEKSVDVKGEETHPANHDGVNHDGANHDGRYMNAGATTEEDNREKIFQLFNQLGISTHQNEERQEKVISSLDIQGIADHIKNGKCGNIIVMTGAGISTSAGIPDFRSPGTGLYSQLEKYNLPYPQAIFEINYFKENPEPFFLLAKELYPGNFEPTPSHYFIKLLSEKGLLLRNYTQNIDGLESVAGIPQNEIIAAHGTFMTSHCISCAKSFSEPWMKEKIFASQIPRCSKCEDVVKPDIVFFGESLPQKFLFYMGQDFSKADLLIVMGTSLTVQPFANLINRVGDHVPRLLINKEKSGQKLFYGGFDFDGRNNYRDVALLGPCDDGCLKLAEILGWKDDFERLVKGLVTEHGDRSSSEDAAASPPPQIVVEETSSSGKS